MAFNPLNQSVAAYPGLPSTSQQLIQMCTLPSHTVMRLWLILFAVWFFVQFVCWLVDRYSGVKYSPFVLEWVKARFLGLFDACTFLFCFVSLYIFWVKGDFRGDFYVFFTFLGILGFLVCGVLLFEKLQKKSV